MGSIRLRASARAYLIGLSCGLLLGACASEGGDGGGAQAGSASPGPVTMAGSPALGAAGNVSAPPMTQAGTTGGGAGMGTVTGMAGTSAPVMSGGTGGMVASMAGMGGSVASEAGAGGESGPPPMGKKPPCITKASQGILLGDSYVNFINNIEPRVSALAVKDGAIPNGMRFRDYAVAGTSLAADGGSIPPQWDNAKRADPDIKFVIMDGGGNDVLLWNMQCLAAGSDMNAGCQKVVTDANAAAKAMMENMKASGVSDVVFFFYPYVPAGGDDILDYSYPLAKQQCEGGSTDTFRCHFIDTRQAFMGHADYIGLDGIHPTATGADVIAGLIYDKMKMNCIGQPESSGCCEP